MVRMALVTEMTSLLICIIIGCTLSLCFIPLPVRDDWPTQEMMSRSTWQNFLFGVPVAFFSGLGVAVGLLDSQTNSLVGVAISASLLPPAVNAGMLWVLAIDNPGEQYFHEGTVSLFLTLMNISIVIVASMFMFRLKEVRFRFLRHGVNVGNVTIPPNALTKVYPFFLVYFAQTCSSRRTTDSSDRKEHLLGRPWSGTQNIPQSRNSSGDSSRTRRKANQGAGGKTFSKGKHEDF